MKRAVLTDIKQLRLETVAKPACPVDGLLVRIKTCAVCASDVKIYNYGHPLLKLPRVLGHEIAGVIEEVGPQWAGRFSAGQRVAVCAVINCGQCKMCLQGAPSMCESLEAFGYHHDGGYEEYMVVPAKAIACGGVNVISEQMSFAEASIAELLACTINGQHLSDFRLGQSVLIIGSGPVGILHAQLAHMRGAAAIYMADIDPHKLEQAERICGARLTETMDNRDTEAFLQKVNQVSGGYGFDQVMLCCGVEGVVRLGLECVGKCGCVNLFGGLPKGHSQIQLDVNHIHYKQCRVVGTHGSSAMENRQALQLIECGRIDVKSLITGLYPLEALEQVLTLNGANSQRLKSVVQFDEEAVVK